MHNQRPPTYNLAMQQAEVGHVPCLVPEVHQPVPQALADEKY